jgi:hypothetical protein
MDITHYMLMSILKAIVNKFGSLRVHISRAADLEIKITAQSAVPDCDKLFQNLIIQYIKLIEKHSITGIVAMAPLVPTAISMNTTVTNSDIEIPADSSAPSSVANMFEKAEKLPPRLSLDTNVPKSAKVIH